MANANTEITLEGVHTAIENAIREKFPALKTVEFYCDKRTEITLPACLLEMSEFDGAPDDDPNTGQLAVTARFEARFVISYKTRNAKLAVRNLATSFAAWAKLNRFSQRISPAEILGGYPDDFDPRLDQHEVWRVEWQHVIHLGKSEWDYDGETPTIVLVGQAPFIGDSNEEEYTVISDE
jgi:hypothetical protein